MRLNFKLYASILLIEVDLGDEEWLTRLMKPMM